jgi:dihydropteroate synthase
MLGQITSREIAQRTPASVTAALIAVEQGARLVRVHDVAQTRDALRVWMAVTNPEIELS